MIRLSTCVVCGFISSRRSEFTVRDKLVIDKECAEKISEGEPQATRWFAEAKAKQRT